LASENADPAFGVRPAPLKHFQEKWETVFRPKMRQNKKLEPHSDSIGMGKALERGGADASEAILIKLWFFVWQLKVSDCPAATIRL
jgi:hypothetical protein